MNFEQTKKLIGKIKSSKSIGVFMHREPDGDTAGSALALRSLIMDNFKITPICICDDVLPNYLKFIPGAEYAVKASEIQTKFDIAIAVDVAALELLGKSADIFKSAKYTANIDHHLTIDAYADINIKKPCPATGMMIYDIARSENLKIYPNSAISMYAAIVSDTKNFNNVTEAVPFRIAADLIQLGANPSEISAALNTTSKENMIANANTLAKTKFFLNGKLAITHMSVDDYNLSEDKGITAFRNMYNISNIDYSVIIVERPDGSLNISMQGKYKPVLDIAKALGGGGHKFRAGAQPKMIPLQAELAIIAEFKKRNIEK